MANDYRRHYHDIDFLEQIKKNSKYPVYIEKDDGTREFQYDDFFYPKGRTGYEQYYVDFEMNSSQGVVAY
jgi:hypothetical protein